MTFDAHFIVWDRHYETSRKIRVDLGIHDLEALEKLPPEQFKALFARYLQVARKKVEQGLLDGPPDWVPQITPRDVS